MITQAKRTAAISDASAFRAFARTRIDSTDLRDIHGEDSIIFNANCLVNQQYVFKYPQKLILTPDEIKTSIEVAKLLKIPLVIGNIHDSCSNQVVGNFVVTQRLAEVQDLFDDILSARKTIKGRCLYFQHSDDSYQRGFDAVINQKICMTVSAIQAGYLPDLDLCNVGFNPATDRVQLFDFGGIRKGVNLEKIRANQMSTFVDEAQALRDVCSRKMHGHSDEIAYRLIRLRDCHHMHKVNQQADIVWAKYDAIEKKALQGQMYIRVNDSYEPDLNVMVERVARFSDSIKLDMNSSLKRISRTPIPFLEKEGSYKVELSF